VVRINAACAKDVAGDKAVLVGAVLPHDRGAHHPAVNRMAQDQNHRGYVAVTQTPMRNSRMF
jgi:hypothetical protein